MKTFPKFSEQIIFMKHLSTATFEFIENYHSLCPFFSALLLCRDKGEEESWPVQNFMSEVLLANNAFGN